jgi:ABC-type Zn uptake system ZnuABC Zn-binding protein ZnuA
MKTLPSFLTFLALLAPGAMATAAEPATHPVAPAATAQEEPLKVIATLPTYGDLAAEIGGELVDVTVVCRPTQDMHLVSITPSVMARVQHADMVLYTGLDAEPWLDPMLRGSGNFNILPGSPGAIAMSDGVPIKEVPAVLSRTQGDIHAYGNPHVWADPLAVRTMAATLRDALSRARPEHAAEFEARCKDFSERLTKALIGWLKDYSRLKGRKVVTYHPSWPYFLERFGIELAATIEPKPRVAPTASHLEQVIETMKAERVGVIIREPFQDPDATEFVARATGATVLELTTHPDGEPNGQAIIEHFERNLATLAAALDAAEGKSP